jgi:hypothetical protein
VTVIAASAFGNCSSLTGVEIPGSVTNIGAWAFLGCTSPSFAILYAAK